MMYIIYIYIKYVTLAPGDNQYSYIHMHKAVPFVRDIYSDLQYMDIMRTQNRYLKICIY